MTTLSEPGNIRAPIRTWRATTAGILTIVAGAFEIILGIFLTVAAGVFFNNLSDFYGFDWAGLGSAPFIAGGAAFIVIGIVAIIGGAAALRRTRWGLALAGAILALGAGSVLGILAIIFIAMARDEFRGECCQC